VAYPYKDILFNIEETKYWSGYKIA
jgi:hypothetical protein